MKKETVKRIISIVKFAVLVMIIAVLPILIMVFRPDVIDLFRSRESIDAMIAEYKTASVFIFIGMQVLQMVIAIIPGQLIQVAAGYTYGFWISFIISFAGAVLGTIAAYYVAMFLGRDVMHLIFDEKKISDFIATLNSKRAVVTTFILFLIPGIPKDLLIYAAGVSEMKARVFVPVSILGRVPSLMGSLLVGGMIKSNSYTALIVLVSIGVVLFILGVLFHKRLIVWFDKVYDKLVNGKS
jgi:uncharacterized membrane protein YdjX (TVP38/TMEM64 family)